MPERRPNQIARVIAVTALIGAFLLVALTIATSGDDSDGGDSDEPAQAEEDSTTKAGEKALEKGVWIVRQGDTLVSIADETGVDISDLEELNPDIDPQTVRVGQRIALREGIEEEEGRATDAGGSPGADATGVGDEGPTGTGTTTSPGFGTD